MVNEIMSRKIVFSDLNNSINNVAKLMKKNNIGFIPIKENNDFIGVVTDRDICLLIPEIKNINDSIKSYITNSIIYINSNATIDEALKTMANYKVKRLLVKEKENTVGVLSLSDILNYSNNNNIIATYKTIFSIKNNKMNNCSEIDEFYL